MADALIIDGGPHLVISYEPQAFLVVQLDDGARVIELLDEVTVTLGSAGQSARFRRRGRVVDLESEGTVNGARVMAGHRLEPGDLIAIGPILAILGLTRGRATRASDPSMRRIDAMVERILADVSPRLAAPTPVPVPEVRPDMRSHLAEIERATITSALDSVNGNQTRAARILGLSRRTLIYRMEKYGLKPLPDGSTK